MRRINRLPKTFGPLAILIGLVVILSLIAPRFFTGLNLINIMLLLPIPLILAIGAHFVIQTGSIDLSVEGIMAVASIVTAMFVANSLTSMNWGVGGILMGMAAGTVLGAINGFIYIKGRIPSFIVSLGLSLACTGLATIMYGGNPISILDRDLQQLLIGRTLGLPSIFWWGAGFFVLMFLLERYLPLSNHIRAIGGNEMIAKQAGVHVNRVKLLVFMVAGACYGLGGALNTVRLMIGSSDTVSGFLFATITSVVVGGTALTGGRGSVLGVLIGVLIIQIINNGMILLSLNPYLQAAVQGAILIVAIAAINRRNAQMVK
jgi:ribose transport system permease protein